MARNIDKLFTEKLTHLVREVLKDEAKFYYRKDQDHANLHNHIFSKANNTPFARLPEGEKTPYRKYFFVGDVPKSDVPFSDSPADQASFFDNLRTQVKFCTYNYDRMDFLRPTFSTDEDQTPDFTKDQTTLLLPGLVYPMIHNLEKQDIAAIEQQQGKTAEEDNASNPYETLANKILVRGESGEFDTVLTFAQIEEIAAQENMLRGQGLPEEEVIRLLKEFINNRFPNLKIYLSPQGKIITYLGAAGLGANGELAATKSDGKVVEPSGELSFTELRTEMKLRLGRKLQYDALIASNGTLGFSTGAYQIKTSDGVIHTVDGLTLGIDQGGQGNNAVYFLTDRQGISVRVTVDTSTSRTTGSTVFNLKIYDNPEIDDPAGHKIKLDETNLGKLKTPLLSLYKQEQDAREDRRPATELPVKPPSGPASRGKLPKDEPNLTEHSALPLTAGEIKTGALINIPVPQSAKIPPTSTLSRKRRVTRGHQGKPGQNVSGPTQTPAEPGKPRTVPMQQPGPNLAQQPAGQSGIQQEENANAGAQDGAAGSGKPKKGRGVGTAVGASGAAIAAILGTGITTTFLS